MRKIQEHPCFSEKACHNFGRCHIPVAPNAISSAITASGTSTASTRAGRESRQEVLNPDESMEMVKKVVEKYNYIKVVGIADRAILLPTRRPSKHSGACMSSTRT